ncbi:hypothetical protein O988_08097 [Pseudogymnoascus sp. VKM F-3808]|nr:hypothetical protein O988_08097 [Pseudogymnoascus sp. VKM F-3808]
MICRSTQEWVIHALGLRLGITLLGNGWDNKQLKSPPRIPLFPALRARISSLARTLDRDFAGRDSQRPPATDRIINVKSLFQHDDIFLKSIYFLIEFFSTASSAYTCDTRTSVNER